MSREEEMAAIARDCLDCLWGVEGVLNLIEGTAEFESNKFPEDIGAAIRLLSQKVRATVKENEVRI